MTKQRYGSVIVVNDNQVIKNCPFTLGIEAEEHFLSSCKEHISDFDEYTKEDIENILDNGFVEFGNKSVSIMWF